MGIRRIFEGFGFWCIENVWEKLQDQGDSDADSYPFIILKGETGTLCGQFGAGLAFLEFYRRSVLGGRLLPPLVWITTPNQTLRGNLSLSESERLRFVFIFGYGQKVGSEATEGCPGGQTVCSV